jgi:predicted ATP-dependent serine protease
VIFINQVGKNGTFIGKNTVQHAIDAHMDLYVDDDKKSDTFGDLIFELTKYRWGSSNIPYILEMKNNGIFEKNPPEDDIVHSIDDDVESDEDIEQEGEAA